MFDLDLLAAFDRALARIAAGTPPATPLTAASRPAALRPDPAHSAPQPRHEVAA
jgi:hypothetical protein